MKNQNIEIPISLDPRLTNKDLKDLKENIKTIAKEKEEFLQHFQLKQLFSEIIQAKSLNQLGAALSRDSKKTALLQAYLFADDIVKNPKKAYEIDGILWSRTFNKLKELAKTIKQPNNIYEIQKNNEKKVDSNIQANPIKATAKPMKKNTTEKKDTQKPSIVNYASPLQPKNKPEEIAFSPEIAPSNKSNINKNEQQKDIKDSIGYRNIENVEPYLITEQINKRFNIADKEINKPYKYGETWPNAYDCSGLITYVFKQLWVDFSQIKRFTTGSLKSKDIPIKPNEVKRGDFFHFKTHNHVEMAAGEPYQDEDGRWKILTLWATKSKSSIADKNGEKINKAKSGVQYRIRDISLGTFGRSALFAQLALKQQEHSNKMVLASAKRPPSYIENILK